MRENFSFFHTVVLTLDFTNKTWLRVEILNFLHCARDADAYKAAAIAVNLEGQAVWPWNGVPLGPPSRNDVTHIKGQNKGQRNQSAITLAEHGSLFKLPICHGKKGEIVENDFEFLYVLFTFFERCSAPICRCNLWWNMQWGIQSSPARLICKRSPSTYHVSIDFKIVHK